MKHELDGSKTYRNEEKKRKVQTHDKELGCDARLRKQPTLSPCQQTKLAAAFERKTHEKRGKDADRNQTKDASDGIDSDFDLRTKFQQHLNIKRYVLRTNFAF